MLKVEKLNKSYTNGVNTYPVLKDVSLHVKKGSPQTSDTTFQNLFLGWP